MLDKIILVGDELGVEQLLRYMPREYVKAIVGASIRPQYNIKLAEFANDLNIPFIVQPKYKTKEYKIFIEKIKELNINLLICNSYSMILQEDLLTLINYNAINIHWALLPKNRGSNPIQWSIIKGEKETGVTIHYMNKWLDSGDIIEQVKVNINIEDTWITLKEKLKIASTELLKNTIPLILNKKNMRYSQNADFATINKRLNLDYPKIDFNTMTDLEIYNLIRAQIAPLKGAYIEKNCKLIYYDSFIKYENINKLRDTFNA